MGAKSRLRTREEIDGALKLVEDMAGSMELPVYHKLVVSLAYEYLCCDQQQEGLVQLSRVPRDYYENHQLQQMQDDGMYAELVVLLSYKLIQAGVVDGSEDLLPVTMAQAKA